MTPASRANESFSGLPVAWHLKTRSLPKGKICGASPGGTPAGKAVGNRENDAHAKTTHSKHWLYKHPSLVKDLQVTEKEQPWVADISYINTKESTAYLSLITDAYSRKIVGHHLHTDGVEKAQ